MRVLVTRPEREALQWALDLRQHGLDAHPLPLMAVGPVQSPEAVLALARAWRDLGQFAAAMFVSANAVRHFFAARPATAVWPSGELPRTWAPGPGTAEALLAAGVARSQVDQPAANAPQFDSEALWSAVQAQLRPGQRLLLVRGADGQGQSRGRDWLAQQVTGRGASVHTVVAYQRCPPVLTPPQRALFDAAHADGAVWLFSSSEAVCHWRDLRPMAAPPAACAPTRAVATHPRIAEAARAAGFDVVCTSRPAIDAVVASIKSMA